MTATLGSQLLIAPSGDNITGKGLERKTIGKVVGTTCSVGHYERTTNQFEEFLTLPAYWALD